MAIGIWLANNHLQRDSISICAVGVQNSHVICGESIGYAKFAWLNIS